MVPGSFVARTHARDSDPSTMMPLVGIDENQRPHGDIVVARNLADDSVHRQELQAASIAMPIDPAVMTTRR